MGENRECKIVQDLLPNYIENLTDEETNKYIEEHIGNCEKCKIAYENMKQELKVSTEKSDKREIKQINGFKKINSKLKFFKVTLFLIILILLLIFVVNTGRKMIIISSLSNKAKEYESSDNYHWTTYSFEEGTFSKYECYKMKDKLKTTSIYISNDGIEKSICIGSKNTKKSKENQDYDVYNMHDYYDIYQSTELSNIKDKKIAVTNSNFSIGNTIPNPLHTNNLFELFKCAIKSSIQSTTIYGKECYYIKDFKEYSPEGMYVDKKTGMPIRYSPYKSGTKEDEKEVGLSEQIYEFNTVMESDFTEPDISEYELMTVKEYLEFFDKYK